MEKRRVVVTGLGTVNPTGNSVSESWENVKNGVSFTITPLSQLEKNVDKGL